MCSASLFISQAYPVKRVLDPAFFPLISILWAHFYVKSTLESCFSKPVPTYILIYFAICWTFWSFLKICCRRNALMGGCLSVSEHFLFRSIFRRYIIGFKSMSPLKAVLLSRKIILISSSTRRLWNWLFCCTLITLHFHY